MEKYVSYIDIGFKIFIALVAAWSAYLFGYRKQQNDDVKLVTELISDERSERRLIGVRLAAAFVAEDRIPSIVFAHILLGVRDDASAKTAEAPDKNMSASSDLKAAATSALNAAAAKNTIIQDQVERANSGLPVRLYMHTTNTGDRALADALGNRVERLQTDASIGRPIVVPDTEVVASYSGKSELRCFKAAECRDLAPRLISLLKAQGAATLADAPVDLSRQYENSNRIRPMHFEVWFAAGGAPK